MDPKHLETRAILALTLDVVGHVNEYMNAMNDAWTKTCLSCDFVCKSDTNANMLSEVHTPEFLNNLRSSDIPNHCTHDQETVEHLFFECPVACQLWNCGDILQGKRFWEVVEHMLQSSNTDDKVLLAARLWVTWTVRNDWLWNGKAWSIEGMQQHVVSLCTIWKDLLATEINMHAHDLSANEVWTPPPMGVLKCNVDAVLFEDGVGYGAILRDHTGRFVAARSGRLTCTQDPYLAEAMAVKEALAWLKEYAASNVILESDSLNFCSSYNSFALDFSHVGLAIKQCHLIARDIVNVSVRHVKRSANHVAHVLARATGSLSA